MCLCSACSHCPLLEQLKGIQETVIYVPSGGTRSPVTVVLIINCLCLLSGTVGKSPRLKIFFFCEQETGDLEGLLSWERSQRVLLFHFHVYIFEGF